MKAMRTLMLILCVLATVSFATVSSRSASSGITTTATSAVSTQNLQQEIESVENGLLPAVVVSGEAAPRMTITDRMAHYRVPGVSIAVIKDNKIEWAKGYGRMDEGDDRPVTTETMFQAASISKPVASIAALHFVQDGKLNLDEDVNNKLTSWKVPENELTAQKKVTLRELMSHSAGMTVHGFSGYADGQPVPTIEEILDGKKPANSPPVRVHLLPGGRWEYSGGGITVMQLLLMDVIHKPFAEIMQETVLDKIGMNHSTYQQPLPAKWRTGAATGHRPNGKAIKGKWHTYPEEAAAGLWTTPSDLARFAIELSNEYMGRSDQVLSPSMAKQMLTVQIANWGLGVSVQGQGKWLSFSHGGSNEGFRCYLVCFPDAGMGAAIMTNSDSGDYICQEILRSIAHEYGWPGYSPKSVSLVKNPNRLDSYVGGYSIEGGVEIDIVRKGDKLFGSSVGGPGSELLPIGDETFISADDGITVTFVRTDINQVIGVIVHAFGQEIQGQKVK